MAGKRRKSPSTVANRFVALCNEKGQPRIDLDRFIEALFKDDLDKAAKTKTNVANFLRSGTSPSSAVRDILKAYARDRLAVELRDSWFEEAWHPSGLIDAFCMKNTRYESIAEGICGDYIHVSRKVSADPEQDKHVRKGRMAISRQGIGFFRFDMGSETSPQSGENPFSGFLTCHSDTLFLTGFDQARHEKMLFLVLHKPPPMLADNGVKLCGMQAGTLPYLAMASGRAFAKRVVLVDEPAWNTEWKSGSKIPEDVIKWLHEEGLGFTVELVVPHADEDR